MWEKRYTGEAPANALYDEACPIGSCQITKASYDGHGRLSTQKKPEQDGDTKTIYTYYDDDKIQSKKDGRGATTNYEYEERGLLKKIIYGAPANSDYLTPFLSRIERSNNGGTSLTFFGKNFSPNAEIIASKIVSGGTLQQLKIYSGGEIIRGTSGNLQTLTISVSDSAVLQALNDISLAINIKVPNTNRQTGAFSLHLGSSSSNVQNFGLGVDESVPGAPTVEMAYDAVGNRIWMTDGLGRTDYKYDQVSRLKSETRQFTETINGSPLVMPNAPLPDNSFKLQYSYGLTNQLTSLTDPYGAVVNYGFDKTGRLKNVTGTTFGNVSTYVSDAKYRAWNVLKELNYGSGLQMAMNYNNRLQAGGYYLSGGSQPMSKNYDYYADGNLRYVQDLLNPKFDRLNTYDHVGRIKEGKSGLEARGGVVPANEQSENLPYRQSYSFDEFGNFTARNNLHWGMEGSNHTYSYKNNRLEPSSAQQVHAVSYNADGQNLQLYSMDTETSTFNAAGQITFSSMATFYTRVDLNRSFDGNGGEIKRKKEIWLYDVPPPVPGTWNLQSEETRYYVRSSVLGGEVVSEVWANGKKAKTFVRAAGSQLAYQSAYPAPDQNLSEYVIFDYTDASGMSRRPTDRNGQAISAGDGGDGSPVETDALGNNVGTSTPYIEQPPAWTPDALFPGLDPWTGDSPFFINGSQLRCFMN